jgi:hypothetical protein
VHHDALDTAPTGTGVTRATASVADAPIFFLSFSPPTQSGSFQGQVATFIDYDITGRGSLTNNITWGDGTSNPGLISFVTDDQQGHPIFQITAGHNFGTVTSPFGITIQDSGGTSTTKFNNGMGATEFTIFFDYSTGTFKTISYGYF